MLVISTVFIMRMTSATYITVFAALLSLVSVLSPTARAADVVELYRALDYGPSRFTTPGSLIWDRQGVIYFKTSDGSLRRFTESGAAEIYLEPIHTADGLVLEGGFLDTDGDGTFYTGGHLQTERGFNSQQWAIFRIDPDKTVNELLRFSDESGPFEVRNISAVQLDSWGDLYFTGLTTDNLLRLNADGTVEEILKGPLLDNGIPFESPVGFRLHTDGSMTIVLGGSNNLVRRDPQGVVTQILSGGQYFEEAYFQGPGAFAFNDDGQLFVRDVYSFGGGFLLDTDDSFRQIIGETGDGSGVITRRGTFGHIEHGLEYTGQPLIGPGGVITDSKGNFYTFGSYSHNLFRITPEGEVTVVYSDSAYSSVRMQTPRGMTIDEDDNLYLVTGGSNRNIIKIFADSEDPESPQAAPASFANKRLDMPPLLLWGRYFDLDLYTRSALSIVFEMGNIVEVPKPADNNYVIIEAGIIHLPEVIYESRVVSWDLLLDLEQIVFRPRLSNR